ncbi:low molecular weight phosphotyrosine protein phosphatase [Agrobacterium larrymoorei]|uniref:low molecular weight protein-tyrosine-phosphatase n=1 Tax=Agrobacterium larrymoorei TaxID=160699 RepID=UPI00157418CA|nr:low molecular weight protein-tyrosine-phosphatase [Agrobacterium larrymoorei]NTJ43323.1 low molecular weight phosphotyrosine protein phosphatase [Agrobacterium larrymoorei]
MKRTSILFVCMGNICRSPLAEGIFSHLVKEASLGENFVIASAGTGGWHAGNPPDPRSIAIAYQHGIDISQQRARQVRPADFENYDLILAMDEDNLSNLRSVCPQRHHQKLRLFSQYTSGQNKNVPDPYYGGEDGFLTVYTMLLAGCTSLLEKATEDRASCSGNASSTM